MAKWKSRKFAGDAPPTLNNAREHDGTINQLSRETMKNVVMAAALLCGAGSVGAETQGVSPAYDIPKWEIWCVPAYKVNLTCTELLWEAHNYGATPPTSLTPPPSKAVGPGSNGAPPVGTTDTEIQSNFPNVFLYNFQHDTTANAHIAAAGPYEIAWLSSE